MLKLNERDSLVGQLLAVCIASGSVRGRIESDVLAANLQ
jgi:hypothetical protein